MTTQLKLTADPLLGALRAMECGDYMGAYGLLIDAINDSKSDARRAAATRAFVEVCRTLQVSYIHEVA